MADPIVIIDYDAGNVGSVVRALARVDRPPVVSADFADFYRASAIVLPGDGAAGAAMASLRRRGLVEPIREYIAAGRPFLGVCIGLQLLFEWSDEDEGQRCLGLLPGRIRRFTPGPGLKVPHMGWNTVAWTRDHPFVGDVPSDTAFYFVHSYYPDPSDPSVTLGKTEYGVTFPSVVARGSVVATQFHPEKSGAPGLALYANFVQWARAGTPQPAAVPGGPA